MRSRIAALFVIGALTGLGGVAQAPAITPTAIAAKSCAGYTKAKINGETKCLRRGQFCAKAAKSQYPHYGFKCINGRLK
jgi:hypothetical protein